MQIEIGSEYWISEFPSKKDMDKFPSFLKKWKNIILTSSGRGAINLAIEATNNSIITKTALLPAYCCHTIIDPFIKSGFEVFFYDINKNLKPDIESIKKYIGQKIGIFLHMGYFGFDTNNILYNLLQEIKSNNTFIIEDVTHTLFSNYNQSKFNDFYIGSIRKWLGIPSGAFFSSKERINLPNLKKDSLFSTTRKSALELKNKYIRTNDKNLKPQFLNLFNTAEEILDAYTETFTIDDLSLNILNNTDIEHLKLKRSDNYKYLLNKLKEIPFLEMIFIELPNNLCPLFLPVYVKKNRDFLQKELIKNKIYVPIHWPIPRNVNLSKNIKSGYIYNNILSIPIDQRYGEKEMSKIINVLKNINTGEL